VGEGEAVRVKTFLSLMILLCFVSSVSAYDLTIYVRDYNTKAGIASANISLYEPAKIGPAEHYFRYTNDLGFVTIYDESTEHYINITKNGYFPDVSSNFVNVTNDTVSIFYLRPISTNGLVKIMWTDDTVNMPSRRLCFFYAENGRMAGCIGKNETFWGINNHAYTVEPETNFYDFFTSTESLWVNRLNIIPYLGITLFLIFILMKVLKKR